MLAQINFQAIVIGLILLVLLAAYIALGHARSRLPSDKPWRRLW